MADRYSVTNMAEALERKNFPTVTVWNRIEGRPRTANFERALRAEVRDALWMVTRQWQVGEFNGEDAGSAVLAKARVATTQFTQYKPGDDATGAFVADLPLETQVERLPWRATIGGVQVALDLRLMFGRRWLRLIAAIGDYAILFAAKYKIRLPDPTQASYAVVCAHPEVWQAFAATAERAVDGIALYQYLKGAAGRHAYDGVGVLNTHKQALDLAAGKFIAFVERTLTRPETSENPAWQATRLEYRFAVSAPVTTGDKAYVADEYYQGDLDWHSMDVEPAGIPADPAAAAGDGPRKGITRTMIPVPVSYAGMPHPRWWTIEDSRTNFGEIRPDTTDLAKLLFIEFGLVYSNDWFVVPFTLPGNSIVSVEGLAVTNVFGERVWIEPAGRGADRSWQRWGMFTVSVRGQATAAADTSLLLLPVTMKIQESSPLEQVLLMRDEMANMVWAIEKTIPAADGVGRSGATSARETRSFFERLVAAAGGAAAAPAFENDATIRYDIMSTVPENWIPFVPVRASGSQRAIELQRGAMIRIIDGDLNGPLLVQPRTPLLRVGLDQAGYRAYVVPEEEVPRAGVIVAVSCQRTRWRNGKVVTWLGASKQTGRGEGSSGLAFDRLVGK